MAEGKRQKPIWYVIGCIGLALLSVPCLGVAAAIAIPAFVNYARRAKTTEARANVAQIAAVACAGASLPEALAPTLAAPGPERQMPALDPRWTAYGLTSEPSYYAYAIERHAATAVVVAEGDLDGDGTRSRFASTCALTGAGCTCGELTVTNELE
jgi:Tfp pilus assembly major pilin PilA